MIELNNCYDKCFADDAGQCTVLAVPASNCNADCPFYKPKTCKDWVRTKDKDKTVILPPEEYERRHKANEEDRKHRRLYWHLERVPKG